MNKTVLSIVIVAVIAVALGTAGFVYAQTPTPQNPGFGFGNGMSGRGPHGGMGQNGMAGQEGLMHDEMVAAFAEKLGLPADELEARLDKGETMAQIASSKGLTAEQFTTLMTEARSQAVDQAVKDGKLTQVQANWMKQHGAGAGMGAGRGMRATGQGQFANPNCPYYSQTNP
jgi:hypothetical protein